ncbi:hypothetical protein EON83_27715 [bacterium]|nr:MAG: hypothetical protein EON83_27715 [bacterium]
MKRVFLPLLVLPLLAFAGCGSGDRKAYLEKAIPELITQDMQAKVNPSNTNASAICKAVDLTLESPGHYIGEAFFTDGRHTQIKVVDDGDKFHFHTDPF